MRTKLYQKSNNIKFLLYTFYLVSLAVVTVAFVYYIVAYLYDYEPRRTVNPIFFVLLLALLFIVNGILLLMDRWAYRRITFESESRESSIRDIEKLNKQLRVQRHDFLNHIQVLYTLMELKEYEETSEYLNKLYGDIIKLGEYIKTDSVAFNALLAAKASQAEKANIHFDLFFKSRLSNLPIGEWELCRIVGNLIDNGLEALAGSDRKKVLTLQIYETITTLEIRVRNNGPFIDEKLVPRIFEAGVSTKKEAADHGMGLYIVKKLLEDEGHTISLEQETDVCFHIILKKQITK